MKTLVSKRLYLGFLGLLSCLLAAQASAERIKDLASVQGVRSNQLIGYGLVVGLNGTGDKDTDSPYTINSLKNMLTQFGVRIPPGTRIRPKNAAAVIVHGELPAFSKPGQTIDVSISSLGNAKSLRGGSLLMTPLKGADGQVYAMAQGNLIMGGLSAEGQDGSKVTVNSPSTGSIPNGATVEREVENNFSSSPQVTLNLHEGDFTTAMRVAESINLTLGPGTAKALDSTSIRVQAPTDSDQKVSFVSMLETLEVKPGVTAAKVIVNSRTGTVVINSQVRVYPAAVSHGNLVVSIRENPKASQPGPFARRGETVVLPQSDVTIEERGERMFLFDPGVSLDDVVRAVNEVGAAPSDLVAILEALKAAGALQAELLVI